MYFYSCFSLKNHARRSEKPHFYLLVFFSFFHWNYGNLLFCFRLCRFYFFFLWLGSDDMNIVIHLTVVPTHIDHSKRDAMISKRVFSSARIFRGRNIIWSIYPEKSEGTSFWIIRILCCKVHTTGKCITKEIIVPVLIIVFFPFRIKLHDCYRFSSIGNSGILYNNNCSSY